MVVLDWVRIWSSVVMIEYIICFAIFLSLGVEFIRSNRREARAVGIVFFGACFRNLFNVVYHLIHDGLPTPSWVAAIDQTPILFTLLYLMYVLLTEEKVRKGNGKDE